MNKNQAKKLYQTGLEVLNYGKPQEAINYFREAVEADPSCVDAHLELGYLLGVMENYEDALKHFTHALNIERTFPALFCKGICLFFLEDYNASLETLMEAQELGENEDMWYYLGNLHLIYTGNYEAAVDCLGNAIAMNDEFIEAWNDLGVAYNILEDDDNAILCFEECLNIDSGFKEAIYNMGVTLADMGRYEKSLKYLDQTLRSDLHNFKALFYKGNVLYFMEREEEAVKYFKRALDIDNSQEELWNYLGYVQFSIGQNYEAIESLSEAVKLNSNFETAYINLGNVYSHLGKNDLALNCYKKVLEISPDNKEAIFEIEYLEAE
ncbi:MAG: tetratricopeptide repeat protein [Methanobacterium sp.]